MTYEPVVGELEQMISDNAGWSDKFDEAVTLAHDSGVVEMKNIKTTKDYLDYLNGLLRWVPCENVQGKDIYNHLCKSYFVLNQKPVAGLQNPIAPFPEAQPLTPLSAWLVRYSDAMGAFLDTPESITPQSLESFRASPNYNMDDYVEPRGGWRTFNEVFARAFKPGYRPVAAIEDPRVIVSAADCTFGGQWEIRKDSKITLKNLDWDVGELLEGSPYRDRFVNGQFMHAFLGPNDYHRQHAPVGGTVLEARVIPGQVYLEVIADPINGDPNGPKTLRPVRRFDAPDSPGYQFAQARGLIVLDTPIGLVAVLPIGMCQVSSVILTAEVGVTVRKGEELAYFQFGGSDIILLFEARSNVSLTAQVGVHYKMGTRIGEAFPVV
jgi:phosphatidylserine decarboxylase